MLNPNEGALYSLHMMIIININRQMIIFLLRKTKANGKERKEKDRDNLVMFCETVLYFDKLLLSFCKDEKSILKKL